MEKNIFEENKPEANTGYLLWQISNLRQRKINIELIGIDLTYPQFIVLVGIHWLKQDNKIVNQILLSKFIKMDKSVVSSVLTLLKKKEFITRDTCAEDTRSKTLDLSTTGISSLEKAMKIIQEADAKLFDSTTSGSNNLNNLLLKILKNNSY